MSRNIEPVCRLCRREGVKLFLKGARCQTAKCALTKREAPAGMHPFSRRKPTEYSHHLREKQKVCRYYGIRSEGLRRLMAEAQRSKDPTGTVLLQMLERRLDNILCRSGLAKSRAHARQAIGHGHVEVNGRKVFRPGFSVSAGDLIRPRNGREKSQTIFRLAFEATKGQEHPSWLAVDPEKMEARMLSLPTRQDVPFQVQEQLIVEFASR
ncbi:MAG: 30S ribosomal protein S4 [Planctomycetota bacterium]